MHESETLLRIVRQIYEAAEVPTQWTACLHSIRTAFASNTASFVYRDHHEDAGAVMVSVGVDEECARLYARYGHLDPFAPPDIRALAPGSVALGDQWIRWSDLIRTDFYGLIGRPFEVSRSLAAFPETGAATMTPLVLNRGDRAPAFSEHDADRLRVLMPHLQQALRIQRRLTEVATDRSAAYDAIDQVALGVVILDEQLRPVFVNRAAAAIAAQRDGLTIDADGLRASTATLTGELRRIVGSATRVLETGEAAAGGGHLLLPRASGRRPFEIQVAPVRAGRPEPFDRRGRVVVFINDPERKPRPSEEILRRLYGLTTTEVRVALALSDGRTLPDIADAFSLTRSTVRWHMKRILSKTGASTQAQLVRLVMATSALVE